MGRIIGYARTSTADQLLDLQLDALRAAGAVDIHTDQASGVDVTRPGLAAALRDVGDGDVLVVWRLDRLGRSVAHLAEVVGDLVARGVGFRSLTEAVETTSAPGRLMLHLMGAFAEFERDLIRERIVAGMAAAKQRGRHVGRRPALTTTQVDLARRLHGEGMSLRAIAEMLDGTGTAKPDGGRRRLSASTVLSALRA